MKGINIISIILFLIGLLSLEPGIYAQETSQKEMRAKPPIEQSFKNQSEKSSNATRSIDVNKNSTINKDGTINKDALEALMREYTNCFEKRIVPI